MIAVMIPLVPFINLKSLYILSELHLRQGIASP